jgi:hypothetical protein
MAQRIDLTDDEALAIDFAESYTRLGYRITLNENEHGAVFLVSDPGLCAALDICMNIPMNFFTDETM